MTVASSTITNGPYTGNDIADTFSYTFRVEDKSQLAVFETDAAGVQTTLTVDTDYTVTGVGVDAGGTVIRTAGPLPTNFTWFIRSDYKLTQLTAFSSQGAFFPDIHEAAIDKLTYLLLQLSDIGDDRAFRLASTIPIDGTFDLVENAATRANRFLGFDSSGNLISSDGTVGGGIPDAPIDGMEYIRKDAAWSILDIGANVTIDSAQTGVLVKNTFWAVAATSARTRSLPASPANGDEVTIFIASGDTRANNVTIGRNGNTIDDIAADKVLTISCIQKLKFDSAASNWVSVLDTNRTLDGRINHWKEVVRTLSNAFIDANLGTWQKRTLAGNETLTFDLFSGQSVYLTVVPGANTLTLTNVTEWVGGAAPSTIEAEHAFVFWSDDGIAVTGMSIGGIS